MTIASLLLCSTIPSWGAEVKFLKTRFMNAQRLFGAAFLESARLKWEAGKVQEEVGFLIRDEGSRGRIDQELLGQKIAQADQLKWRMGRAQEQLGFAALRISKIVSQEEAIKGGVQEDLGRVILSQAQLQWIDPKILELSAQRQAGLAQEVLGREVQRRARFAWAEAALARSVQGVLLSSTEPEKARISEEVLSILREGSGRTHEENLLRAKTLMDKDLGSALGQIVPSRPEPIQPTVDMTVPAPGWGGFGEFGLPALLGFFWAIGFFLWIWTGLEHPPLEHSPLERAWSEKTAGLHKAA
jgi:hypothetical protein